MNERYYFKLKYADSDLELSMYEPVNIKITHSIAEDGNVGFGNTPSASITFDLYDAGPGINNELISVWYGTDETKTDEFECLGIFKMQTTLWDSPKHSYIGYDAMVYAFNELYDSKLEYPTTVDAVAKEIEEQTGIMYGTAHIFTAVVKTKPENMTYRQVLGYLAGLGGCDTIIQTVMWDGGSGVLRPKARFSFRQFYEFSKPAITDDMIYEDSGLEIENKDGYKVEHIKCYLSEDELLTSGDTTTNGITIYNPYMYQARLDTILSEISDIVFYPIRIKFIGDMQYNLHDIVNVATGGVTYKVPVASITQECDGGLITTIECFAEDEDYEDAGTVPSSGGGSGSGGGGTSTETAKYLNPPNSVSYRTGEKGEFIHKRADTSDYFAVKSYSGKEILKIYYESGEIESNGQKLDLTPITAENIDEWYGETVIPDAEGFKMISELEAPEYDLTALDFELQVQTCEKVE